MKLAAKFMFIVASLPALVPAGDFHTLVGEFSRETGARETKIAFMGFARFVVAAARPAGASDFKLALFEHVNGRQLDFINTADGLVSHEGWNRIVRVRSKKGEATNIYMRPEGKNVRMLVTMIDTGEAVFVETRIKPEQLARFIDEHKGGQR